MRRRSADAGHMTPVTDDEDGSKLVRRLNHEYEELQEEANEVAKRFNETRFDIKCLTTVFKHSNHLENITFAYEGMEPRYSKFGSRYCEVSQHEMSRPFISTLSALAVSGVKAKHIKMYDGKEYGAISIGRLESLAPSLRFFDAAFETLETLQLNLRDWRSPDSGFELEGTRAPFVVRFLAKFRNVRALELSCYSSLEDDLFGEMARMCQFGSLEKCKLDLFRISCAHDLIDFLALSSNSLKELRLEHVLLVDSEKSWADLFTSLADPSNLFPVLKSLHVVRLFTQRASSVVKGVMFQGWESTTISLRLEGKDWREELKDHGRNHVEFKATRMWEAGATMYPYMG